MTFSVINSIIKLERGVFMYKHQESIKQMETMRENLRIFREKKGWSVEELSQISKIDVQILLDIESDKDFDVEHLFTLCQLYGTMVYKIFF